MIEQTHSIAFAVFAITYAGVALGGIPGLAIDRTGIAILGAASMVVFRVLTTGEAVDSIDIPTILLLYSLMVISSQFRLGGFYTRAALKLTEFMSSPGKFLFLTMFVSAGLSAVLTNDIICLAFTPILTVSLISAGLNPIPFLIGLALSSTFAGNLITVGSIANLIVIEKAKEHGVSITFKEHAKIGIPVTLASFVITFFYIAIMT